MFQRLGDGTIVRESISIVDIKGSELSVEAIVNDPESEAVEDKVEGSIDGGEVFVPFVL